MDELSLDVLVPYLIQRLGALQLDLTAATWQVDTLTARVSELETTLEQYAPEPED